MATRRRDWATKVRVALDQRDRGDALDTWHHAQVHWDRLRRDVEEALERLRQIAERHRGTLSRRDHGTDVPVAIELYPPPTKRPRNRAFPGGLLLVVVEEYSLHIRVTARDFGRRKVEITDQTGRKLGSDLEFAIRLWMVQHVGVRPGSR